jgi:hypothetical protein
VKAIVTAVVVLAAVAVAAEGRDGADLARWAGTYQQRTVIEVSNGPGRPPGKWPVPEVLEIVPVDRTHAYIRVHTEFDEGHVCAIWGVARLERETLVYSTVRTGPKDRCTLVVRRAGAKIVFEDPDGTCKWDFCGQRGDFVADAFAVSSRRPIRYMKRLLASPQYHEAMAEWDANGRQ